MDLEISLILELEFFFVLNKFMPNYKEKLSNLTTRNILIALGIGLGFIILTPIISILLFITNIGSILGLLLLVIYILFLILAKSIFVISIASIINKKDSEESFLNSIIKLFGITIALALINLIPYIGSIISILVFVIGLGILVKSVK